MNVLEKLTHLEKEAEQFGFKWENTHQIMAQIKSECDEIDEHLSNINENNKPKLQEGVLTISPAEVPSSFKPAWLSQIFT